MKILIFVKKKDLGPIGGVSGYCYNILKEKNRIKDKEISFLSFYNYNLLDKLVQIKSNLPFIKNLQFRKKKSDDYYVVRYINEVNEVPGKFGLLDFDRYDVIHFQTTFDLYQVREKLENYRGIVVLTSHSPKVSFKEYAEDNVEKDTYIANKELFDKAEKFDEYAFKRADYIIFPCPGAEEPYYHSWPEYARIRKNEKIKYVPTGIVPVKCNVSRENVRKKFGIPQDAILLSFVGRHNEVKGYDILQQLFCKIPNIYIICCGKIGPLQPLNSNRWIEIGWTEDPYSIVGASDIYLLPNRETYFDIAMLQALSIGKCSVISKTGGNKEFVNTPGIKLYESVEEAVNCINSFIEMPQVERNKLEKLQRIEFKNKYSIEIFYREYKTMIKRMLEEKNNG